MSAAVLDAPTMPVAVAACGEAAGGSRATLEELLDAVWRSVRGDGQAECPVCHATMRLERGLARCRGCGSTLT
jgi:hypothetical protein